MMSKPYYQLLVCAGLFGWIGAAIVGVEYALVGFKTGDVLTALPPAFIALLCMALFHYSMGRVTSFDALQKTDFVD